MLESFLNAVMKRLFVLDPPGLKDFDGTYRDWMAKQSAAAAPTPSKKPANEKKQSSSPAKESKKKSGNPYNRQFGKLSIDELESEISKAEKQLVECQRHFGDAGQFKDPARSKELHSEYDSLKTRLAALEAEYYLREH